eukprot:XP_011671689.1 PREDICTED: thrombospondin type-1 domain-containing protein 4 isoform X2 [Strongylocentrotus purpuratus]
MCKIVGCDGVLGSGLSEDKCGVCGGSNTECQIFSGVLDTPKMTIGYHTVITIPAGSMYVNITEMTRSRNYLGLQITGGVSVFNGDWSIDYPGNYSAAGTNVMYTRSARSMSSNGEQILIMGPTAVDLDVKMIYQERNPGISYEYVVPNPPGQKEERPPPGRQEEGGRQTSQQNPRGQPKATQPPPTTTRRTNPPTTTPPTTTARTTTRRTVRPTTVPTTPPPPPPPANTNAPFQEEQPKHKGEKDMSISSGVMPGHGMGNKEKPEGYAGVMDTISESDQVHEESQALEAGPDGRYYNRPEGSLVSGGSGVSGSGPRNNPAIPEGQRPPVETVPGGGRASNPGRSNTGRGRDTSYVPSQTSGSVTQTQTEILRGRERGTGETPRQQGQGDATGNVPGVYVSNPQLGRGPSSGNTDRQTPGTSLDSQRGTGPSRPFYGYYPTGYNPPETRLPETDAIPPVSSNSQVASQSSFNRPTGINPPSNPPVSSGNNRPFNYSPNLPSGRGTPVNNSSRGSSYQNIETTAQSGVTSGRFTPGTNNNPQSRLPPTGSRNPGVGGESNRNPNQGGEPTGDIVYNPNYRPPTNQGLPPYGSQGVPGRGESSNPTGQGNPINGQGTPSQTGYGRPAVGQPQERPTFGQGRPNIGQGFPSRGQGVPTQTRPDRYPFRPNPDAIPNLPPQTSSNLPQTSGQIGVYPNPDQQPPSRPVFGQENPETNYSPFNSGVPRPVVPIGGEEVDTYASEDYSSSIPEEGQGNEATFGRNPGEPDPAVNPEALYIWMETGVTECSVSCAGGVRETIVQCISENSFYIADDSMCNSDFRPASRRKACNIEPCPPVWEEGEWSACSRTCGEGRQMRPVTCKQKLTQSVTRPVPLDQCIGLAKPLTTQTCNDEVACTSWRTGSWGQCSAECGEGDRRRELLCVNEDRNEVPESECSHLPRPDETQSCNGGPCQTSWFTNDWSTQCSSNCGSGTLSRGVLCSTEGTTAGAVPDGQCSGQQKPDEVKTCTEAPCGPKWFTSEWSRCSVGCGTGTQTRSVVCVSSDVSPTILPTYQCPVSRPQTSQQCEETECAGVHWFTSEWSECSQSCGGGYRTRHVKCLDGLMQPSTECEIIERPGLRQSCNIQQCHIVQPDVPASCTDKFSYCDKIQQARLCSYSYYRQRCCFSCYEQNKK